MKIYGTFQGEFRSISFTEYKDNAGKMAKSFKIGVELSDADMGMLPCVDLEEHIMKSGIKKGDICSFDFEFNTDYNRLRVMTMNKLK
ncbi:hypothetical protein ABXS75_11875 [Roseburia hominis]